MKFRLLALDLDGTTVLDDGGVNPRDLRAIRAAQDAGIIVTIITGRLFSGTRPVAHHLGVTGPIGVMNGSEIRYVEDGHRLEAHYLCNTTRTMSREALGGFDLAPFVMSSDHVHYDPRGVHHLDALRAWTQEFVPHDDLFDSHAWDHHDGVLAVFGVGEREAALEAQASLRDQLPMDNEVLHFAGFKTPANIVCVRGRTRDKGTALHRIAGEYGLTVDDCVAVGDWFNDLPMLEVAGRSFAMGTAPDGLLPHADEQIPHTSVEGGGIAEVIDRIWGIRER